VKYGSVVRAGFDEDVPDERRAAELDDGWARDYAELSEILKDNPRALGLLDRLVQTNPSEHAAMSGPGSHVGRPSVPTQDEDRPPFPGRPRRPGIDAQYGAMAPAVAADRRPLLATDEAGLRAFVARGVMNADASAGERLERRFPGFNRLHRVVG
jgi:hypothetical protein